MIRSLQSSLFDYCSISSFSEQQIPAIHNIFVLKQEIQEIDKKLIQLIQNLVKDKFIVELNNQPVYSYAYVKLDNEKLNTMQYSFCYNQTKQKRKNNCVDIELYSPIDQSIKNADKLILQINLISKQKLSQDQLNLIQNQLEFMGQKLNIWIQENKNLDNLECQAVLQQLLKQLIQQVEQVEQFQYQKEQLSIYTLDLSTIRRQRESLESAILSYFRYDQHIIFYNYDQKQNRQYLNQLKTLLLYLTVYNTTSSDLIEIQSQKNLYAKSRIQFINTSILNKQQLQDNTLTQYSLYDIKNNKEDKLFDKKYDQQLDEKMTIMKQLLDNLFDKKEDYSFTCYLSFVKTSFIKIHFD